MLNRAAIKFMVKEPFLDWLRTVNKDENRELTLDMINRDRQVYLIHEDELDDIRGWIEMNWDLLLEDELLVWDPEEEYWPEVRSLELFNSFFTAELSSIVIDTVDDVPISDDEN